MFSLSRPCRRHLAHVKLRSGPPRCSHPPSPFSTTPAASLKTMTGRQPDRRHTTSTSTTTTTTKKGLRPLPALFVRGGTSNGLVIRAADLPSPPSPSPPSQDDEDRWWWRAVLAPAMGSPDPTAHARQLDGMGGGLSSTSKLCVLAPSAREDADVDFTFVQVGIRDGALDMAGNCGNMSSVVGPVAWDWGFVRDDEGSRVTEAGGGGYEEALVRIFNTNTSKILHSRFRVVRPEGAGAGAGAGQRRYRYCPEGDYEMDGVPGTQSRITLSFLDPAGAKTGRALPTGNPVDVLDLPDGTAIPASLVDVSNPGVFVRVEDLGDVVAEERRMKTTTTLSEALTPAVVEADPDLKHRLEMIRRAGAARMGLDPDIESVPKIVLLFPPLPSPTPLPPTTTTTTPPPSLAKAGSGPGDDDDKAAAADIRCLAMSMGQAHKAVPLTLALCLGAAANMEGTLPALVRRRRRREGGAGGGGGGSGPVVIGHPSGTVEIGATMASGKIVSADLLRTARILMKGEVYY
ncbi:DUF453-domain-containing protein [Xylariomycetidae sp. FL2044]|nr:DUF453-domain-containing protein [Xylariomycetidae sp. FL2044]